MTCSASPSGAVKPTSALAHTRTPLSPRTHTRLPPAPVNLRWELAAHSPSYDDEIACARPIPRIDVSNPYGAPLLLMPMPPRRSASRTPRRWPRCHITPRRPRHITPPAQTTNRVRRGGGGGGEGEVYPRNDHPLTEETVGGTEPAHALWRVSRKAEDTGSDDE
ncbi:hypothetical protein B0H10DRAFT_1949043 [Mycena sp. CBHHK59/15]|nr:hypothetical protein B0H10DRAFT_1949043 [Mycena sp. CBHHK59/15]